jgi:hypothetical protein
MAMTDEEREERSDQRRALLRAARVRTVMGALSPTKRKTSKQIGDETGLSADLVLSTIRLIWRRDQDRGPTPIAYDPSTHEFWVARNYADTKARTEWLRKHLQTRAFNLQEDVDVLHGLWAGDVPVDLLVAMGMIESAMEALDRAFEAPAPKPSLSATKPPTLHG